MRLEYKKSKNRIMEEFSDADWAGDKTDRKT